MRRLTRPGGAEPGEKVEGGVMDGVMPKTMVIGLATGEDGRDMGPPRL